MKNKLKKIMLGLITLTVLSTNGLANNNNNNNTKELYWKDLSKQCDIVREYLYVSNSMLANYFIQYQRGLISSLDVYRGLQDMDKNIKQIDVKVHCLESKSKEKEIINSFYTLESKVSEFKGKFEVIINQRRF